MEHGPAITSWPRMRSPLRVLVTNSRQCGRCDGTEAVISSSPGACQGLQVKRLAPQRAHASARGAVVLKKLPSPVRENRLAWRRRGVPQKGRQIRPSEWARRGRCT
jgi:hypothetical protein